MPTNTGGCVRCAPMTQNTSHSTPRADTTWSRRERPQPPRVESWPPDEPEYNQDRGTEMIHVAAPASPPRVASLATPPCGHNMAHQERLEPPVPSRCQQTSQKATKTVTREQRLLLGPGPPPRAPRAYSLTVMGIRPPTSEDATDTRSVSAEGAWPCGASHRQNDASDPRRHHTHPYGER